jgi:hypothetical protein
MPAAGGGHPSEMPRCWMCENCSSEDVQHFHQFITRQAHVMEAQEMAQHMHEHLATSQPGEQALPGPEDILAHIHKHMLHPHVRVAQILRNLLDLAEMLQELTVSRAEDGTPLIDVRTVTVYLKVVAEIMQVYKTSDLSKMLFAETDA